MIWNLLKMKLKWFNKFHEKKRLTILIVEDDVFLKPLMAKVVYENYPHANLLWTTSVQDGKKLLVHEWPDLVIVDCLLGNGETGLDLWNYCRKYCSEIPFLMMSGLSQNSIRRLSSDPLLTLPPLIQKPFYSPECKLMLDGLMKAKFGEKI
jgi:DNA-binding NtrC family response regulator